MSVEPMSAESLPIGDDLVDRLAELVPEAVVDGVVDPTALLAALGEVGDDAPRFEMLWPSKPAAREAKEQATTATLVPDPDGSVDWDTTENVLVAGDNLQVLKLLQRGYRSAAKLIYIDPPYNTGESFIYGDNFAVPEADYLRATGQIDEDGLPTVAERETSGRKHGPWMSMMLPRLAAARRLLRRDGVMVVAIDDNEVHYLRVLLDGVFGSDNFIGTFVWNGGRKNDAKFISAGHDYMVCYARDRAHLRALAVRRDDTDEDAMWRVRKGGLDQIYAKEGELRAEHGTDFDQMHAAMLAWYRSLPNGNPSKDHKHYSFFDERGLYYGGDIQSPNPRENLSYRWREYRTPENGWRFDREEMERLDGDARIIHPASTDNQPKVKRYLRETEYWAPSSVFYTDRRGGSKRLTTLMGKAVFDNPKDPEVLKWVVGAITSGDDLVIDFFAGSGTTGHAVWLANAEDGGHRRWLLVQEPAAPDPALKTGRNALEDGYDTIFEISAERLRRAGVQQPEGVDAGFRLFHTAVTNLNLLTPFDVEPGEGERYVQESIRTALDPPVRDGVSDLDLLWEVLLKATDARLTSVVDVVLDEPTVWRIDAGGPRVFVSFADPSVHALDELGLTPNDVVVLRSDRVDDGLTMTLAARCRVVLVDQVPGEVSV